MARHFLGKNARLYGSTNGSYSAPSYTMCYKVMGLTHSSTANEVDVSSRGNFTQHDQGQKTNTMEFTLVTPASGDTSALATLAMFQSAYDNDTQIDLVALRGASASGMIGPRIYGGVVTQFEEDQPLDGAITHKIKIVNGDSTNDPETFTVP